MKRSTRDDNGNPQYDAYVDDDSENEETDEDSDDDDGDSGAFRLFSFDRTRALENTMSAITMTGVVPSPFEPRSGAVYFRTEITDEQIDPLLHDEPPHMWKTLDGDFVDDVVYNYRHAVDRSDEETATRCLVALFDLFVALNRPMRCMKMHYGSREFRLSLRSNFGPFANSNAYAMHQFIFDETLSIFFDQIGIATPTAILEIERLWDKHQRYLFCDANKALASLLMIGRLLCRCYKDGSVTFSSACWADTAKDRKFRDQLQNDSSILAVAVPSQSDLDKCIQMLAAPDCYYTHRSRLREYAKQFLLFSHPKYLLQAKSLRYRDVNVFVETVKKHQEDYARAAKDDGWQLARELILLLQQWAIMQVAEVNYLLGHRTAQRLQCKMILFLHQLSGCFMDRRLISLGAYGLFNTSAQRVADCKEIVGAAYARSLRECGQAFRFEPKYGIIGDDGSDPSRESSGPPTKKKKKTPPPLNLVQTLFSRPPVVPRSQVTYYPGMEVKSDGRIVPRPNMDVNINRPIAEFGAPLRSLYLTKMNEKKLLRSTRTEASQRGKPVLDKSVFDFRNGEEIIFTAPNNAYHGVVLTMQPAGEAELRAAVAKDDAPSAAMPSEPLQLGQPMQSINATIFKDYFNPEADGGWKKAIVYGPFPTHEYAFLAERVRVTSEAKRELGVETELSVVANLVLSQFPLKGLQHCERLPRNRPALFVVHVPRQRKGVCLTLRQVGEWLSENQLGHLRHSLMTVRRMAPSLVYTQLYARAVQDPFKTIYVDMDIGLLPEKKSDKTKVVATNLHFSIVLDDIYPSDKCPDRLVKYLSSIKQKLEEADRKALKTDGQKENAEQLYQTLRNRVSQVK